ncbi:MAG: Exopolysaccharide synthesis, ExoD [Rhodobacteraceae bacterium HLUCCO07]|nr:MAG: Exopolysaccharide synthesis, ExoD [Rhodobacteraceae bacterium HLUCCO07]
MSRKDDRNKAREYARRVHEWSQKHIPPGLRLVAGILLMIGGVLGFLPIVGFWMFPLGIAVAAADVMPIWRWWKGRKD